MENSLLKNNAHCLKIYHKWEIFHCRIIAKQVCLTHHFRICCAVLVSYNEYYLLAEQLLQSSRAKFFLALLALLHSVQNCSFVQFCSALDCYNIPISEHRNSLVYVLLQERIWYRLSWAFVLEHVGKQNLDQYSW